MRLVSSKPVNSIEEPKIDKDRLPKVIRIHTLGKEIYLVISNTLKIEVMDYGKIRLTNKCLYTDVQIDSTTSKEGKEEFISKVQEGILDDNALRLIIKVITKKSTEIMSNHIINAIMITENEVKILQETEVSSYSTSTIDVENMINENFNLIYEIPVQNFRCLKINI